MLSPLDYFKLSAGFPIETIGYRPLNVDYRGKTAEAYAYVSAREVSERLRAVDPNWTVEIDQVSLGAVYQFTAKLTVKGVTRVDGSSVSVVGQAEDVAARVAISQAAINAVQSEYNALRQHMIDAAWERATATAGEKDVQEFKDIQSSLALPDEQIWHMLASERYKQPDFTALDTAMKARIEQVAKHYNKLSLITGAADVDTRIKGGMSDALKRAAVLFGVGACLYKGTPRRYRYDGYSGGWQEKPVAPDHVVLLPPERQAGFLEQGATLETFEAMFGVTGFGTIEEAVSWLTIAQANDYYRKYLKND